MPVFSRFSKYVLAVAQTGSIRSAAEYLNIAPSAVDRQIINAEQELGVLLFERLPHGMRPTSAGEHLVYNLRRWSREFESVQSQIEGLQGLQGGRITVAVGEALAADLLVEVIDAFHEEYPRIVFDIRVVGVGGVREMVLSGNADMGITFMPTGYRVIRIEHSVTLVPGLVMPADHELARRKSIHLRECTQLPIVLPDEAMQIRQNIEYALQKQDITLNPVATANNFSVIRALVKRGIGLAILTQAEAQMELRSGEFVFVPFADKTLEPTLLSLVTSSHPSVTASRFTERLVAMMNDMV